VHAYCTRRDTNGKVMKIVLWYCLGIKVFLTECSKATSSARCQLTSLVRMPILDCLHSYKTLNCDPINFECCECSPSYCGLQFIFIILRLFADFFI
jgi:hypothetical protein